MREPRDTRDLLVQSRVVFHRARAERVQAEINRIIPGRDASEVAHHIDLGDLGHPSEIVFALQRGRNDFIERGFLDVERRQAVAGATFLRALEYELLVLAGVIGNFGDHLVSSARPLISASIWSRVFVSVTQTRKTFGRFESNRDKGMPPSIPIVFPSHASNDVASTGARTTNSLKKGAE